MSASEDIQMGNTLVAIGMLSVSDISQACQIARELKQPLLKVLIQSAFVTQEQLLVGLDAVNMLSCRMIDLQQAKQAYARAAQKGITLREAASEMGFLVRQTTVSACQTQPPTAPVDEIAELLVLSGTLDKATVECAAKLARMRVQSVESVLVGSGHITAALQEALSKLRSMLEKRTVTSLTAADVLRRMRERSISLHRAMAEMGLVRSSSQERLRLGELLKQAGFISEADLEEALKLAVWNDTLIGKMLVILGMISEQTLQNGLRCQFMLREGRMRYDQAIIALHYCERMRCSVDDAIREIERTA